MTKMPYLKNKLAILIMIFVWTTFFLAACGESPADSPAETVNENGMQGNDAAPEDGTAEAVEDNDTAEGSDGDVPETNVPIYPGSELIYSASDMIVYASNASIDALYSYYEDVSEFTGKSRMDARFHFETDLAKELRSVDFDAVEAELNESGPLLYLVAFEAGSEDEQSIGIGEAGSLFPSDKNIYYFTFFRR